jgi:hypothetical protein
MRKFALIILSCICLFLPLALSAQTPAFEYDLGITSANISWIPPRLVVGQKIRIYASVENIGKRDTTGYISFYQGTVLIGDSQPVSLRAGGFVDEVFVDFVVPPGTFNIRADLRGQTPRDDNPQNDVAITKLLTPEYDTDADGIPDSEDNCPKIANPDQKDADGDKLGDLCDDDADNDGVSNAEEIKKGADPLKTDTDSDGFNDKEDAFPLDPLKHAVEKEVSQEQKKSVVAEIFTSETLQKKIPLSPIKEDKIGESKKFDVALSKTNVLPNTLTDKPIIQNATVLVSPPQATTPPISQATPQAQPEFFSFQRWSVNIFFLLLIFVFIFSLILSVVLGRRG